MSRRIFSNCFVLGLLLLSLVSFAAQNKVQAQALTPTPTPACLPLGSPYYAVVTPSATSVNAGDQIVVTVKTNVGIAAFYLSIIDASTGQVQSQTNPIFTPATPASQIPSGGIYTVQWTLTAARPGTVIFQGRASGEILVCSGGQPAFTWGSASGQSANVTVSGLPITPTPTSTPTRTPTRTPAGPTPTRTRTPTVTPTLLTSLCNPVTASIAAPFTRDGAGTFCWQSSNLGAYVNSWNLDHLTINGVSFTNVYVTAGSYPAKINGFWYVSYTSSVAWGHFETR